MYRRRSNSIYRQHGFTRHSVELRCNLRIVEDRGSRIERCWMSHGPPLHELLGDEIRGRIAISFYGSPPSGRGYGALLAGDVSVSHSPPPESRSRIEHAAHYVLGYCALAGALQQRYGKLPREVEWFLTISGYEIGQWTKRQLDSSPLDSAALSRIVGEGVPLPFRIAGEPVDIERADEEPTVVLGGDYHCQVSPTPRLAISPTSAGFGWLDRRASVAALMAICSHFIFLRTSVLPEPAERVFLDVAANWCALAPAVGTVKRLGFQAWYAAAAEGFKDSRSLFDKSDAERRASGATG